jgi:hypothetical protein
MSRDVFIAGAAIQPFGKHRGTATEDSATSRSAG